MNIYIVTVRMASAEWGGTASPVDNENGRPPSQPITNQQRELKDSEGIGSQNGLCCAELRWDEPLESPATTEIPGLIKQQAPETREPTQQRVVRGGHRTGLRSHREAQLRPRPTLGRDQPPPGSCRFGICHGVEIHRVLPLIRFAGMEPDLTWMHTVWTLVSWEIMYESTAAAAASTTLLIVVFAAEDDWLIAHLHFLLKVDHSWRYRNWDSESLWKPFPLLNFRGFLLEYLNFVDLL
jgi:hypothetical protein